MSEETSGECVRGSAFQTSREVAEHTNVRGAVEARVALEGDHGGWEGGHSGVARRLCNLFVKGNVFAALGVWQEESWGAIAVKAMVRPEEFNPQSLANTVWVSATLGVRQEELLGEIAGRALVRLEEFNPQNLANTAWAFATLGVASEWLRHQTGFLWIMEE